MGDKIARLNRDRALFQPNARRKLIDTISAANPEIVARVVVRALEMQIVMEEFARSEGVTFDPDAIREFHKTHLDEIDVQLERAIGGFVGSIVSQEG